MVLEGAVTNVAAFGAFVDIGVHQDGLVHVSAMSRTFVKDPRDVVKPGDIVKVKVLDVDIPRKRISLTLRLDDENEPRGAGRDGTGRGSDRPDRAGQGGQGGQGRGGQGGGQGRQGRQGSRGGQGRQGGQGGQGGRGGRSEPGGALADALRRAGLDKGLDGLNRRDR
jgi:uncharacterized protein